MQFIFFSRENANDLGAYNNFFSIDIPLILSYAASSGRDRNDYFFSN